MILIFSSFKDLIMNDICVELTNLGKKFLVINENTQIEISYDIKNEKNTILKISDNEYNELRIIDISTIWIRKGNYFKSQILNYTNPYLSYFINKELEVYMDYFEFLFSDKFKLSKPSLRNFNKLKFLSNAKKFSIKIPRSFIINSRKKLKILLKLYPILVTKPLSDIINPQSNISMYTKVVDVNNYKSLPDFFFQVYFKKKLNLYMKFVQYFYLGGHFLEYYSHIILKKVNQISGAIQILI